ncbi:TPA: extensin family protein [Pseudomonas aeruginosa]|nr:extensin family protein [Pseudomonas aeruginosa]
MRRLAWLLPLLLLAGAIGALRYQWLDLPARWNPWLPLDVREPPNLLTRYKLWRLADDRSLCDAALATSQLRYQRVADDPPSATCPLSNSLRVRGAALELSSSFLASCPLAVSYALFERHVLQPAALDIYGQPLARVEHVGSFACRNVYNREDGRRSQHASANALDISGFRLADGRRIRLATDWAGESADGRFLRRVRDGACASFNAVLGPDYNAAHRDHFYLDMGLWKVCR